MGFRGNSFDFDVIEKQKLLYLFLSNKANAIEFYNKFNFIINSDTKLEDLDKIFEVQDETNGSLSYYLEDPTIVFFVKNKETQQKEEFTICNFHSVTDLPFEDDEINFGDYRFKKILIKNGDDERLRY